MDEKERAAKNLEKAEHKIRILEDMIEHTTRNLYLANMELEHRSGEKLFQSKQLLEKASRELSDYKLALDASAIVSIVGVDGKTEYVNALFCSLSGFTQAEILGQDQRMVNSGFHDKDFFKIMFENIRLGKRWRCEIKNKTKDGHFYWLDMNIIPFNNKYGKPERYISISFDITEKKQRENELERQNRELQQFVYIASHDLQEPVRTIDGFARLLNTNYGLTMDEVGKKSLSFIADATTRLSMLIKGLLDYGRLGRNAERKPTDLNVVLDHVCEDLGALINDSQAEIIRSNLPEMNGFETELHLLFQNLITNAIKFRKKDSKPVIQITSRKEVGFWHFQVKDNGIGIDPAFHKKIFQIFQKLHSNTAYEGSGIGLAHCQKIVELHDGLIWVESELGKGSTFHLTLSI